MSQTRFLRLCMCILLTLFVGERSSLLHAQGIALTGVGPVNRSMGGAGTAAPLDAIGALHWNPGSISALPANEIGFGLELLRPDVQLSTNLGGSTSGDAGWVSIPSIGWVQHLEGTPMSVGLGLYGVAGFKNNLPLDPTNPILAASPAYAAAEILQIAPTLSYALNENLSVGIAPTITTVSLTLDPLGPSVITPAPTPAQGNRMHWGGGFQVGLFYQGDDGINAGFSFKSPQWVETLNFFTPAGTVNFDLDYPMILSLGLSYTAIQNWVFAIDGRYVDYEHTDGFREFGWRSVFGGAIGVQYQMTDRMYLRAGYNFNQSPIQSDGAALNLLDPLIQKHNVAAGATYRFTDHVDLNVAYVYLVDTSVTGPFPTPPFPPGSTVTHDLAAHSAIFGISVRY